MISNRKKGKHGTTHRRKSDKIMTLKTRDIAGPRKYPEDLVVISEENTSIGARWSALRMKI